MVSLLKGLLFRSSLYLNFRLEDSNLPNGSSGVDELPVYLQRPLPVSGPNSPRNLERENERKRVEKQQEHAQQVP